MTHKRLGHSSFGYLERLSKFIFLVARIKILIVKQALKQIAIILFFPSSLNKSTNSFDLLHSDVVE
jgi:hypothetical protein